MNPYRIRKKSILAIFMVLMLLIVKIGFKTEAHESSKIEYLSPAANSPSDEVLKLASPRSSNMETVRIAIDPGHGGTDPGATGVSGVYEKDFSLSLAKQVYDILEADPRFEPYLTRNDDQYLGLIERTALANQWQADVLISIHGNTYIDSEVRGTETIYRNEDSLELAQIIQQQITNELNLRDRGIKQQRMEVLSIAEMPAVLIETGYLTNADEERFLLSQEGQRRTAQAIVNGLMKYFAEKELSIDL